MTVEQGATQNAGGAGASVPGWYPDPTHRFELRYHNGADWTADVASDGSRFVDPHGISASDSGPASAAATAGAARSHAWPPSGGRNGVATAALVLGIVSIGIGWLPFVVVIGALAAVLAIVLGFVGRRRSRTTGTGSGFALAGLITGVVGLMACIGGVIFTVAFLDAFDDYNRPAPHEAAVQTCRHDGRAHTAEVAITNLDRNPADFTVRVVFVREGTDNAQRETVVPFDDVAPGATATEVVTRTLEMLDVDCVITEVHGPLPFGVDPGT